MPNLNAKYHGDSMSDGTLVAEFVGDELVLVELNEKGS